MQQYKCTVLLPRQYNDKTEVLPEVWNVALGRLLDEFGAYTSREFCFGVWINSEGIRMVDSLHELFVVVEDNDKVVRFKALVADVFVPLFKQEAIYCEVCPVDMELIS